MIETTISGIPCQIQVDKCDVQKPMGRSADSDWDCNGYEEIEFTVLDRRGYPAPWLAKKLSPEAVSRIEVEILESRQ